METARLYLQRTEPQAVVCRQQFTQLFELLTGVAQHEADLLGQPRRLVWKYEPGAAQAAPPDLTSLARSVGAM